MKLCIFTDDGELHEVVEDIDEYDLTKGIGSTGNNQSACASDSKSEGTS